MERWIAKKRAKEALLEKQKSKRLMEHNSQRTLRATFESHQAARVQGMSTLPRQPTTRIEPSHTRVRCPRLQLDPGCD